MQSGTSHRPRYYHGKNITEAIRVSIICTMHRLAHGGYPTSAGGGREAQAYPNNVVSFGMQAQCSAMQCSAPRSNRRLCHHSKWYFSAIGIKNLLFEKVILEESRDVIKTNSIIDWKLDNCLGYKCSN